ncbi:MAG: HEAT repeat domain-containing protein [Acidobacteriaceae bacterium]|jgi:HEAT repeat protein|nr:HEAT repeat domain-containing protein [Acidobacteriaceae bacterium]
MKIIAVAAMAAFLVVAWPNAGRAQGSFEQTVSNLTSTDHRARMRAVQILKDGAYEAAAVPLARTVLDERNDIQLESIAAELKIFLAEKSTSRKYAGRIAETHGRLDADAVFTAGPGALGARRVPLPVVRALITVTHDGNPKVVLEAVYALGALGGEVTAADRAALLRDAAPVVAGLLGVPDPALRYAAVRVAGRLFAVRPGDAPIDDLLGHGVIAALNDREEPIREAAMDALGSMRYEPSARALGELFRYYRKGRLAVASLGALARIGQAASVPEFVEQMSAKDVSFRVLAIEGLARTGDRSRNEAIQVGMGRENQGAVLLAAHFANVMLADGAVDVIVASLADDTLHEQAMGYVIELAARHPEAFVRFVQDPKPDVRASVVDALGVSGNPSVLPALRQALQDRNLDVQHAAIRAIARLGA